MSHVFSILTTYESEFYGTYYFKDALDHNNGQVEENEETNEPDQGPATQIPSACVRHESRETDQAVGAHDRQTLVEKFDPVVQWQLIRPEVPHVNHEQARFEDDGLDLEIVALDQINED